MFVVLVVHSPSWRRSWRRRRRQSSRRMRWMAGHFSGDYSHLNPCRHSRPSENVAKYLLIMVADAPPRKVLRHLQRHGPIETAKAGRIVDVAQVKVPREGARRACRREGLDILCAVKAGPVRPEAIRTAFKPRAIHARSSSEINHRPVTEEACERSREAKVDREMTAARPRA